VNFTDTNWLAGMYFRGSRHAETVERYMRSHSSNLVVSPVVVLEARNVFSRESGESIPEAWKNFEADGRFYRDPMNWDLLRREVFALISRYGTKESLGTFDLAIVASARLAGATRMLSFDGQVAALALAEGMEIFPDLNAEGKKTFAKITSR